MSQYGRFFQNFPTPLFSFFFQKQYSTDLAVFHFGILQGSVCNNDKKSYSQILGINHALFPIHFFSLNFFVRAFFAGISKFCIFSSWLELQGKKLKGAFSFLGKTTRHVYKFSNRFSDFSRRKWDSKMPKWRESFCENAHIPLLHANFFLRE